MSPHRHLGATSRPRSHRRIPLKARSQSETRSETVLLLGTTAKDSCHCVDLDARQSSCHHHAALICGPFMTALRHRSALVVGQPQGCAMAGHSRDIASTRFKDTRGHAVLEPRTKTPSTHDTVHGASLLARTFLELFGDDSAEPDTPELATFGSGCCRGATVFFRNTPRTASRAPLSPHIVLPTCETTSPRDKMTACPREHKQGSHLTRLNGYATSRHNSQLYRFAALREQVFPMPGWSADGRPPMS